MSKARDDRKRNTRAAAWPRCASCSEWKHPEQMAGVYCADCLRAAS